MTTRAGLTRLLLLCSTIGLAVSTIFGVGYAERHSSHAGFYRVRVDDTLGPVAALERPRRTVVVVWDGLGYVEASAMPTLARLGERGQCRRTDVGPLSLSRPVFAVLSTGLEQDRTGARGNDDVSPLGAESVWDVARRSGLSVSAVSELPWWRELFPRGFDEYVMPPREEDYFRLAPPADLSLVHPIYVDETGHEQGAGSLAYRDAVRRADAELGAFVDTLDLDRDLLVVTADHGHALHGGHGGRQDRIAHVRTCYAGRGVRHLASAGPMRSTTIGPSIALLLGLRFPAHMRAQDDDLDTLWEIADPRAFPAGYLAERRETVERFRMENRAQLERWLPSSEGSWERFRLVHRALQVLRALPLFVLALLVVAALPRLHRRRASAHGMGATPRWLGPAFVLGLLAAIALTQLALRGSFDLSSVSTGDGFIQFTIAMSLAWSALAVALHLGVVRDLGALMLDWSALSVVGTLLSVAHPLALGWQVGYPAPPAEAHFFPYFAALALGVLHGVGLLLCLAARVSARRRRAAPTA